MAKRSSDSPGSLPPSQTSGTRDVVRDVGIDPDSLCRIPQAAVRHGRAKQSSGAGPCGNYRTDPMHSAFVGSVFGEN